MTHDNPRQILNRRRFLGRGMLTSAAAFGLPYLVPGSVLRLGGTVEANNRIALGFIGVGKEVFVDDQQANRMLTRPLRDPWHL